MALDLLCYRYDQVVHSFMDSLRCSMLNVWSLTWLFIEVFQWKLHTLQKHEKKVSKICRPNSTKFEWYHMNWHREVRPKFQKSSPVVHTSLLKSPPRHVPTILACIRLYIFGQIIATSHDFTPKGSLGGDIPLFQENLGWWNIIMARYMFVKHLVQTWSGKTWQSSVYF